MMPVEVVTMQVEGMMRVEEEMMQGAVTTQEQPATATLEQIGPRTAATETATATMGKMEVGT